MLLNLWEEGVAIIRTRLLAGWPGEIAAYGRAVLIGGLIFGCIAIEILNGRVNSNIIYQAF